MRNMSFALTTDQVRAKTKTVTRRLGWANLQPGTLIQPIVKGMGLKPGAKVEKIGGPIRVVSVRREPLHLIDHADCRREGFPNMTPFEFLTMFCQHNHGCTGASEITRIEFDYVEDVRTVQLGVIEFHEDAPLRERFYHVVEDLRASGSIVDVWLLDIARTLQLHGYEMTITTSLPEPERNIPRHD